MMTARGNGIGIIGVAVRMLLVTAACAAQEGASSMISTVPEVVRETDLIRFPGPYQFMMPKAHIILVSDQELRDLSDPDKVLNLTLTYDKHEASLRQLCEDGQARGCDTLILAFDHFFKQYRPGQDAPRELTCDMPEFIERVAAISAFAAQYGMGLEISLLSPLEIGTAFQKTTGESGAWVQYRKGMRDTSSGAYSVQLWRHKQWVNNKGPIGIEDAGVRVFAFSEIPMEGTPYRVVDPANIIDITDTAQVEVWDETLIAGEFLAQRVRIHGTGRADLKGANRVMVVQRYRVPEMDYFSEKAAPFLRDMLDRYAKAGIQLKGLYSDEMHIQQDWGYFNHHDNGEFTLRYLSDGFKQAFARQYGSEYEDFEKYLVYFIYGQEEFAINLSAKQGIMHIVGPGPEDIHRTALLRSRYFSFLQDGVVDLFTDAKRYAENLMGHKLQARAHATWAESPTIDRWNVDRQHHPAHCYEYTSNFMWSCTVHQAAAACHDYFKWGDYLTGNGTDHAEGGWLDRDYYALALACSLGSINDVPMAYAAIWGGPGEVTNRYSQLATTYGAAGSPLGAIVQDNQHRDVEVLMLYPLDLVASEERFGSWMTQYGYANYITQAKLLEKGKVENGAIVVAGRRYTTLATLFEPFPSRQLLDMMRALVEQGGTVIWSGPKPLLDHEGGSVYADWCALFGITPGGVDIPDAMGLRAPGTMVTFENALEGVDAQVILTDLLVDRIYPLVPADGTAAVARVKNHVVGTQRRVPAGGQAVYLGFRPRDDQSGSLGYQTATWYNVLNTLGCYPASGKFAQNDNPTVVSRTSSYMACTFPNGAVALAPHVYSVEESWEGGFARNPERDAAAMTRVNMPSNALSLREMPVAGHAVTYDGEGFMTFRLDAEGDLVAFGGSGAGITVNGKAYTFTDAQTHMAFAPVSDERRVAGGAALVAIIYGERTVHIPVKGLGSAFELYAEGTTPGSRGEQIACTTTDGVLTFTVPASAASRWLFAVPKG